MNNESFITIAESKNHYDDFVHFMDATTDALRIDGKKRHDYYLGRNGEKLEEDVLQWMKAKAKDFRFNPDSILPTKKQHFPDIISNNYFGVEVKSTKENLWTSTGSSIVESLRDEDIKKVFMMFGILSKDNVDFRCKPYEKCLSDIHVTHSPRYSINMNLSDGDETIVAGCSFHPLCERNLFDYFAIRFCTGSFVFRTGMWMEQGKTSGWRLRICEKFSAGAMDMWKRLSAGKGCGASFFL